MSSAAKVLVSSGKRPRTKGNPHFQATQPIAATKSTAAPAKICLRNLRSLAIAGAGVAAGSSPGKKRVVSKPQWGQSICSPAFSSSNSKWPAQQLQTHLTSIGQAGFPHCNATGGQSQNH